MPYITATQAVQIPADASQPKLIQNIGPNTLYYKSTSSVTSSSNDGSVASGGELEITQTKYVISATGDTRVEITDVPEATAETTTAGPPVSGTSGTGAGVIGRGGTITDTDNGVVFVNEGTASSPYWTPITPIVGGHSPLWGISTDFRDTVGEALADTDAALIVPGSGLRIFGQGIAESDSGLVVNAAGEGGYTARMTTTDEDAHTICIGTAAGVMQPDQHQLLVIDTELTMVSAITLRALFVGFVGTAADAFDPPVTGATTTATLVQDDLAGIHQDVGYTDTDGLMLVAEKSNTAGTQTSLTAAADLAAAGTYQRFRVEVNSTGTAKAFVNKAQVGVIPGATGANAHSSSEDALDADEEVSPVLCLESTSAAVKSMDVRRFATWAYRP